MALLAHPNRPAPPGQETASAAPRRRRFGSESGEGRLGCLVSALLFAAFIFGCIKVVPVYLDKVEFEENLAHIASKAGVDNLDAEAIRHRVIGLARSKDFQILPRDIRVQRPLTFQTVPEIKIDVTYRRKVEFPGYTHTFVFEARVSSFVGRL